MSAPHTPTAVKHCVCGHGVMQHRNSKPMPCEVRSCTCKDLVWCAADHATGANPVAETGALGEPERPVAWIPESALAKLIEAQGYGGPFGGYSAIVRSHEPSYVPPDVPFSAMEKHVPLYRRAPSGEPEGGV